MWFAWGMAEKILQDEKELFISDHAEFRRRLPETFREAARRDIAGSVNGDWDSAVETVIRTVVDVYRTLLVVRPASD